MKKAVLYLTIGSVLITGLIFYLPAGAQENPIKTKIGKKVDKKRLCLNRKSQPAVTNSDVPIFYKTTWGNNPQEGQYRQEMERLLRSEISNVKTAIIDIEKKHEALVQLKSYEKLAKEQTIVLENVPGVWRNNEYVSVKKLIIFHYKADKKSLDCIILESMEKNIRNDNQWTRKILRLYYPNVQSMEMETSRHHYASTNTLDHTSPEVQLKALRFVFLKLRSALYTMDMMIAAYYDKRNTLNYWQIDL